MILTTGVRFTVLQTASLTVDLTEVGWRMEDGSWPRMDLINVWY